MGFLSLVRKIKRKEREMRILILGLDNAGKTTILYSLLGLPLDQVSPTLGFQIQTMLRDGLKIHIWDVGGQSSLRPFWRHYYEETDGLVWVIDATDTERMLEGKVLLSQVLAQNPQGIPLLVFINKIDLIPSLKDKDRVHQWLGLDGLLPKGYLSSASNDQSQLYLLQPCSASTSEGIEKGFLWIIHTIQQRLYPSSIPGS
jgi:ADP-ribosylation factor-like protein 2